MPKVTIRHEFTGADDEDIQAGLRLWASFLTDQIRKEAAQRSKANSANEGRLA